MSKHDDIKAKLRLASLLASKRLSERQLTEATEALEKKAHVRKQDLEFIGESVANDSEVFANTDIDEMNDILGRLGNR